MTDQSGSGGAWHPDPLNRYSQRWWDGATWTDQVIDATGQTMTDPMGVTAAPAVDATLIDPVAEPGTTAVFGAPPPPGAPASGSVAGYPAPPTAGSPGGAKPSNGLAVAALILGVGSLFFFWIPFVGLICVPFALGAIVCGVLGMSAAKQSGTGSGMAVAGIATGALALIGTILIAIIFAVWVNNTADDFEWQINTDPSDGFCDSDRYIQDPDC